jgi:hypothetical protein
MEAIRLAPGADDNGFAIMLQDLLQQNLVDHPDKRRDFARLLGRVAIVVEDIGVSVTLEFESGSLTLHHGIVGIPDVTIRASSDDVMKMSLVELVPRVGLPDFRKANAREVLRASRDGRIRVYGGLVNLPMLVRLTRLMSVEPS